MLHKPSSMGIVQGLRIQDGQMVSDAFNYSYQEVLTHPVLHPVDKMALSCGKFVTSSVGCINVRRPWHKNPNIVLTPYVLQTAVSRNSASLSQNPLNMTTPNLTISARIFCLCNANCKR